MKKIILFGFVFFNLFIISCNNESEIINGNYEFIFEYSATVTLGGFVGITERMFEIGEVYNGTDEGGKTITIRIAEHTDLNDDCPNSWCYQELLNVPREYLKFVK